MLPIADLHADLLVYLAETPEASAYDPQVRCSIPQMQQGGVSLQVLPVFTVTEPGSARKGRAQVEAFKRLAQQTQGAFQGMSSLPGVDELGTTTGNFVITTCLAFENASSFCEEGESLDAGLERLERFLTEAGPVAYVSLTWNQVNRFGGGNQSREGLKADGKHLLRFLSGRGIALDLSHASDALAYEALEFLDSERLNVPVMASHSNARAAHSHARNLPSEIASEIFRRGGVIGLNFIRDFIGGEEQEHLCDHVEHFLSLGGEEGIAFGADWFCEDSVPLHLRQPHPKGVYYPGFADASCYPRVLECLVEAMGLGEETLRRLASENALAFLSRAWAVSE